VDFTLSPDQELLRDTARQLLGRECPAELLRAHIDDPAAADPLWLHLRDFAALGDGPLTDLCLFAEETGYVAAPGPFFPTAALFSIPSAEPAARSRLRSSTRPASAAHCDSL